MAGESSAEILAELRRVEGHQGYAGPHVAPAPPELLRASVYVRIDPHGMAHEVSASLTYRTTWRGSPCLVVMDVKQDRGTRWSSAENQNVVEPWRPWRAYASGAYEETERSAADPSIPRHGKSLTDLARRRLSEALQEIALGYVETADYLDRRRMATLKAMDPESSRQHWRHADTIARDLRAALVGCGPWITDEDVQRGEELARAYMELDEQRGTFVAAGRSNTDE